MSLFGTSTQQQQQQQQQSIFGRPPQLGQSTAFQQPQQQQPQQQTAGVFGQSQAQPARSSLWQPGSFTPQNQKPIPDQIKDVVQKWDDKSPQCAFKHYFYNKVEEAAIPYYAPQPHEDPREWEEALQNKPAAGFMPVLAAGFAGMAERLKVQQRAIGTFNAKLHEINRSLDTILEDHDLKTSVRSLAARRRHAQLARRCLSLAAKTQVLRNRGYALSGDEDDLLTKLRAVEKGIQDPALGARMDDLWGRLIALRSYADNLKAEISRRGIKEAEGLGGDIEAKAKKIVEDYEKQLQHLKKEVEAVRADLSDWEKDQNPNHSAR